MRRWMMALHFVGVVLALAALPRSAHAQTTAYLRKLSCAGYPASTCFLTTGALQTWLWGNNFSGGNATAASPVTVEIGPGTFDPITCYFPSSQGGYTTFRGSGRDRTFIVDNVTYGAPYYAGVAADNCQNLGFQDLSITATVASQSHGVLWGGGGSSTWTNVDVSSANAAWYDTASIVVFGASSNCGSMGEHHVYSSTWIGGTYGWFSDCSESYLFGSEVAANPPNPPILGNTTPTGIFVAGKGQVHLFGSSVAAQALNFSSNQSGVSATGVYVGVSINPGGDHNPSVDMHGGEIAVDVSNVTSASATSIFVDPAAPTATARVLPTSFRLAAGSSGTATRAKGNALKSPFLWETSTSGPPIANLVSLQGYDMYVETDCFSGPNANPCGNGGSDSHLMVYQSACSTSGSPWFDQVRGKCRNAP